MKSSLPGVLLRVFISLSALGIIFYFLHDKLAEGMEILRHGVHWPAFGMALGLYFLGLCFLALRLDFVFKVQHVFLRYLNVLYLSIVALFFNLLLPSAIGGDVAKAYLVYKTTGKKVEATTAIILDRVMGFVAMITMASCAFLFFSADLEGTYVGITVALLVVLMAGTMAFLWNKRFASLFKFFVRWIPSQKWRDKLAELYHAIHQYKNHLGILTLSVILSFIAQSLFIGAYYWVAMALGYGGSPTIYFILVPMISIVSMAPSFGGVGVRELGSVYVFSRIMTPVHAGVLALLMDFIIYGFSILGGLMYAFKGGVKLSALSKLEEIK